MHVALEPDGKLGPRDSQGADYVICFSITYVHVFKLETSCLII